MQRKRRTAKKGRRRRKSGYSPQEELVKALSHPVRVTALKILTERIASPKEISEQIGVRLSNVSYHVRVLNELGLIEVVEEESVRGAVAHFYKATEQPLIDNSNWKKLDPKVRNVLSSRITEDFIKDAANALAAGIFDKRDDRHASRTPLVIDEEGWRQVSKIQAEAAEQILKVQAAATGRMNGSEEGGVHAVVGMFLFEIPSADR